MTDMRVVLSEENDRLIDTITALRAEVARKDAALARIGGLDDQAECCGVGVYSHIGNPPECCGQPLYGLDRAKKVARAALTTQEKQNGLTFIATDTGNPPIGCPFPHHRRPSHDTR